VYGSSYYWNFRTSSFKQVACLILHVKTFKTDVIVHVVFICDVIMCLTSHWPIIFIICKFDIFHLISATDKVRITELTLIHKNIMSIRNSHMLELTLILKIMGQCDVKHILTSPIKTRTPVLKILTYIIICITARPVRLAAILACVSTSILPLFYI
jgi:hypothetical protein